MSLTVKAENNFNWTPIGNMTKKELVDEIKRLRKLVEDHHAEIEAQIEERDNHEFQEAEMLSILKAIKKRNQTLANQANAKRPRKIKNEDREAIIREFINYKKRKNSHYGFHSYIKRAFRSHNVTWGRKAIERILREANLK